MDINKDDSAISLSVLIEFFPTERSSKILINFWRHIYFSEEKTLFTEYMDIFYSSSCVENLGRSIQIVKSQHLAWNTKISKSNHNTLGTHFRAQTKLTNETSRLSKTEIETRVRILKVVDDEFYSRAPSLESEERPSRTDAQISLMAYRMATRKGVVRWLP